MNRILVFELEGNTPSKKNGKQLRKNSRTKKMFISSSDRYLNWHKTAILQINIQKTSIKGVDFPIKKCESISTTLFFADNRGRDNTNAVESIHDLLVDAGVIVDDKWQITGATHQYPVFRERRPGASIIIKMPNIEEARVSPERGGSNSRGQIRNTSGNVSGHSG